MREEEEEVEVGFKLDSGSGQVGFRLDSGSGRVGMSSGGVKKG